MVEASPFAGAGALRSVCEAVDWAASPLGVPDTWSPALRTALDVLLRTTFPGTLLWGPEGVMLYNDAYRPIIGAKDATAIGRPVAEVLPEAAETVGALLEQVRQTREPVYLENALVPLERHGFLEDRYFTFCYSPVCGPTGEVEGVLDLVFDTTDVVLGTRRLLLVDHLRESLADLRSPEQVRSTAGLVLADASADLAEVSFVRIDDGGPAPAGRARVLPLDAVPGEALLVQVAPRVALDASLDTLLRLVSATVSLALERAEQQAVERRAADAERTTSHALQLGVLGPTPVVEGLDVAVRYLPAEQTSRVGGDWHDAFRGSDGSIWVVVGDVVGHDVEAVVAMAQARNVLRGVVAAMTATAPPASEVTPAEVVTRFDHALETVAGGLCATMILGRIDAPVASDGTPAGVMRFTWTNAGQLPPAVLDGCGGSALLDTAPQPFLGVGLEGLERTDWHHDLAPGASIVLYTDGLVERRGEHLDVGLARLSAVLDDCGDCTPDHLADQLVARLGASSDDDVALMVLQAPTGP